MLGNGPGSPEPAVGWKEGLQHVVAQLGRSWLVFAVCRWQGLLGSVLHPVPCSNITISLHLPGTRAREMPGQEQHHLPHEDCHSQEEPHAALQDPACPQLGQSLVWPQQPHL